MASSATASTTSMTLLLPPELIARIVEVAALAVAHKLDARMSHDYVRM